MSKKISDFDRAGPLQSSDLIPAVQNSRDVAFTSDQLATFAAAHVPPGPAGPAGAPGAPGTPGGPPGPTGPTGPAGGGGTGGTDVSTMLSFGTVAEAATAAIPSNINTLAVGGYAAPGDNGGGFYTRVASLPSYYVGDGTVTGAVPPSFVSGGPELVYSTTARNAQVAPSFYYGPTTRPILPGCLAFILVRWLAPGPTVPPSSITDSAGNNYTFACGGPISGNSNSDAFYYCTNPVFGPKGTHIANLTDAISGSGAVIALDWYIVPGFTGAVKDQALYDTTSHPPGVTSISVTMTTPGNQFVVGFVDAGVNPRATSTMLTIDDIPGWVQVAPPTTGHTPIACAVMVNSGSTVVTYAPTFQNTNYAYSSGVVTFSGYPTATLTP